MSSNITFNGVTYAIPDDGDFNWGPDLTAYFIAIASGALQKTGGTFTLGAETDFGASYGLKSLYYKSRHANPAAAGQIRLGNTESISWRNNANGADLALSSNASDALIFNSKNVLFSALGLIVNADVNAAAAIAYSKLNLSTSIVNADIAGAAAIAYSKLAALTASRLLVSDGSGVVSVSSVTSTEAGYLSGVTGAIQTQLNTNKPMTTGGDIVYGGASGLPTRLANGTVDQVLTSGGGTAAPLWTTNKRVIQTVSTSTGALQTGTGLIPFDDTIPQITEGNEYLTQSITPTSTTSILEITAFLSVSHSIAGHESIGLFQDAVANALSASSLYLPANANGQLSLTHRMAAGTTAATTFKIRAGSNNAGTTSLNGNAGARIFGGVMISSITITESLP